MELSLREVAVTRFARIGITYLSASEQDTLVALVKAGKVREAFAFATRGFKYQPEKGDHDMGPVSLVKDEPADA